MGNTDRNNLEDQLEVSGIRMISSYERIKRICMEADREIKERKMKKSMLYKALYPSIDYVKNLYYSIL